MSLCNRCGYDIQIGDWPLCDASKGYTHGISVQTDVFKPYFDIGLGEYVTSFGHRETVRKSLGLDWKDQPSEGDMSARKDWAHEQRKQRSQ
jgi:hypothetical protein